MRAARFLAWKNVGILGIVRFERKIGRVDRWTGRQVGRQSGGGRVCGQAGTGRQASKRASKRASKLTDRTALPDGFAERTRAVGRVTRVERTRAIPRD